MVEILSWLVVATMGVSMAGSQLMRTDWPTFNAPHYTKRDPTVIGRYGPSLQICAKPTDVRENNPQQTYVYPDCTVQLSAQYVTSIDGTCETVKQCAE